MTMHAQREGHCGWKKATGWGVVGAGVREVSRGDLRGLTEAWKGKPISKGMGGVSAGK